MIRPSNSSLKVYVYSKAVDMRKQIDGLAALVETTMELNPFSKSLFVFTNKRRDKLKILAWDKNGFLVWYKRLEKQRFPKLQCDQVRVLSIKDLNLYLDGYDIDRFKPHEPLKIEKVA
ncbi:MAG: IS66 family insertion sequence element accessory protein TnpB [Ketobacter sp.]